MSRFVSRLYALVVNNETGSGWRLPALDGLRGIAALFVLVAHVFHESGHTSCSLAWAPLERGGLAGVVLFFALSGFLLYLPWVRSTVERTAPPRLRHYALRRCLRIMPAYYGSVIMLAILRVVVGHREAISASSIALHFVFLPTLGASLLTVYWTLQVEEFFYWALPILHRIMRWLGSARVLVLSCLVSLGWLIAGFCAGVGDMHRWLQQTPFFLPAFALSMFTAVRWKTSAGLSSRPLMAWAVAGYIAIAPVALALGREKPYVEPIMGLLLAPLASAAVLAAARGAAPWLSHPILRFVGGISFSLYLWHMVVIKVVPCPAGIATSFLPRLIFTLAISLILSVLNYLLVERPFLLLRPRRAPANNP